MAAGLGGGLSLAGPLSEWIGLNEPAGQQSTPLSNPFAGWTDVFSDGDVLLLGTDVGHGNTDVIATIRVEGGITRITQIPRDTYIEAETFGPVKLNALYALGGTDAVKREISHRLGRPVPHHVLVNLSAIRRLADQLGGVEIDVPKRMVYTDHSQGLYIDLQPGPQVLKGRDLEGFLRFRHDEMGDIGRLERQQIALRAVFRKMMRPDQLVRLPALLLSTDRDISTDLGPMELGGLITAMSTTRLETRRMGGRPFDQNGISYWDADWPTASAEGWGEDGDPGGGVESRPRSRFLF